MLVLTAAPSQKDDFYLYLDGKQIARVVIMPNGGRGQSRVRVGFEADARVKIVRGELLRENGGAVLPAGPQPAGVAHG